MRGHQTHPVVVCLEDRIVGDRPRGMNRCRQTRVGKDTALQALGDQIGEGALAFQKHEWKMHETACETLQKYCV